MPGVDPYNSVVRQYFVSPLHAGDLQLPYSLATSVELGDGEGSRLQLSAGVSGDRLEELRFRALGCPHLIAAAEHFCRHYTGQAVSALSAFDKEQTLADLAVPVAKSGRILFLEDAVRELRRNIGKRSDA
jgi:NifU-like protein involved in Fe-S cluster formation